MRAPFKKAIPLLILTVGILVSLPQIDFFRDLANFSRAQDLNEIHPETLGIRLLHNHRLRPIVQLHRDTRLVLAYAMSTHISDIHTGKTKSLYPELKVEIATIFPENIFLNALGLYIATRTPKNWENFDTLFFLIIKNPKLNSFVYPILKKEIKQHHISVPIAALLISFLNWERNFSLAEKLLDYMTGEGLLPGNELEGLADDLINRRNPAKRKKRKIRVTKTDILNGIKTHYPYSEPLNLRGGNLIQKGHLPNPMTFKQYWVFSDMSDQEPFGKGSFCGGLDRYLENSLRIMAFYVESGSDFRPARGGISYHKPIPLDDTSYLLYFRYRTLRGTEAPGVWLSQTLGKDLLLAPTKTEWKTVFYYFNNGHMQFSEFMPLFRMWGPGSLWITDISLFVLESKGDLVEREELFIQ